MTDHAFGNTGDMVACALLAMLTAPPTEVRLESLDLSKMTQEWSSPKRNLSVDGAPLKIGGKVFEHGVGTHARSDFAVLVNRNAESFTAWVGVDSEKEGNGSVRFLVYGDGKVLSDSGVMRGGDAAKSVSVDLRKVKVLRLVVDDAGDGIDSDHADWADAVLLVKDAKKPFSYLNVKPKPEPTMKIARPDFTTTQIHGPRAVGCTPGRDFIFRIPATGKKPLAYAADSLPRGLALDAQRGVISGKVEQAGDYPVRLTVTGPGGTDHRNVVIRAHGLLALTPPMGWNSWNVWGTSVSADKVRAAADAFVKTGLADFGYQYVNIDDAWEAGRASDGRIETNEKFGDMRPLTDYVHSLGLRVGIYSSPGPKTCGGYEGSYQHEFQDAKSWADWGIDYVKYDWCSYGGVAKNDGLMALQDPYLLMRRALDDSGRDIVFSLCQYGMGDVWNWGRRVGGNVWRTTGDIWDSWDSMSGIGFAHSDRGSFIGPGGWNDPDMLVVGYVGWGPSIRPSKLNQNEQITHISLWSMLAAPLLLGCDLTRLDDFTKALIMNHDVIEVDQDPLGKPATRLKTDGVTEVWTRPLFDGSVAVALFNRGPQKTEVSVTTEELRRPGARLVRDLWQRKTLGALTTVRGMVPSHGAMLFTVR